MCDTREERGGGRLRDREEKRKEGREKVCVWVEGAHGGPKKEEEEEGENAGRRRKIRKKEGGGGIRKNNSWTDKWSALLIHVLL